MCSNLLQHKPGTTAAHSQFTPKAASNWGHSHKKVVNKLQTTIKMQSADSTVQNTPPGTASTVSSAHQYV